MTPDPHGVIPQKIPNGVNPRKIPNVVIPAKDPQYCHSRGSGNPLVLETNLDSRFRGKDDILLPRDCYREIATASGRTSCPASLCRDVPGEQMAATPTSRDCRRRGYS